MPDRDPTTEHDHPRGRPAVVGIAHDGRKRSGPTHPAYQPDLIGQLIHDAIRNALRTSDGTRPVLEGIVPEGGVVLLKPNWVTHANEGEGGEECLVTHPEFVLSALSEVLAARPSRVVLGDAPIQRCDLQRIVTPEFRKRVDALACTAGIEVEIVDFRRTVMTMGALSTTVRNGLRDEGRYVLFDLGHDSLLDPLSGDGPRFRVADYDPARLADAHGLGRHRYLLCREAFEADCIISLPKLKTHCKAGITGAVKNLVGLNGDKDFLPHHRIGGSDRGGDCYPGGSRAKETAERIDDAANRRIGERGHGLWRQMSRAARLLAGGSGGRLSGAWHGNDTVWRMVLDLNRILRYGRSDGSLSDSPQRILYSLTDAVVCGQGDGPLRPEPIDVGVVTFGDAPFACERVHAALLGLDASRIPLLDRAAEPFRWPLADAAGPVRIQTDGGDMGIDDAAERFGVRSRAPAGWAGHIEKT